MNPLEQLHTLGQSFWYDNIRRRYLQDGTIARLIADDGLRGITSNPSIFEKAIGDSEDYDSQIAVLLRAGGSTLDIYEALALADIQVACDQFAALYRSSGGRDGYVSLEVSPHLAHDTERTIAEAQRLFAAVARPNVMIKVPATAEGIPAIRELIGEGINVNVTLMFSMAHYEAVARAYMDGLETYGRRGGTPERMGSVASFFVSRVDTAVDRLLEADGGAAARALFGRAAIANSKLVYQRYQELFHGRAFADLRAAGLPTQRLLWASTSTKNPDYPDTMYVDELIGPETVNTMPHATVQSFRDHGVAALTLESGLDEAAFVLEQLAGLGIDLNQVAESLQREGVAAFARSFDSLLDAIAAKAYKMQGA